MPRRLVNLAAGLVLFGVSVALMLNADLGVDSWDVLHQGIAQRTGISFGWIVNLTSIGVLLLWIPLRQRPGIGTIANAIVVGLVADTALAVIPRPPSPGWQLVMLTSGIVGTGVATGLYVGAGLGPGPRDGLMTGLASRTGRSIGWVRTAIELTVLAGGWLLGGPVGVGTVLFAVTIGPLTQFFLGLLAIGPVTANPSKPEMMVHGPDACLTHEAWC
jgi:uncharacterized membrane protein YczE